MKRKEKEPTPRAKENKEVKKKGYYVNENQDNKKVANLLAQGLVIGRFCGKSEFGQRALGNRSILADPSKPGIVEKINRQIKYRDFWMPFTPSMLYEEVEYAFRKRTVLVHPVMLLVDVLFPVSRLFCYLVRASMKDLFYHSVK